MLNQTNILFNGFLRLSEEKMKKILFILSFIGLSASAVAFAQFDFMGVEEAENSVKDNTESTEEIVAVEEKIVAVEDATAAEDTKSNTPKDDYFSGFIEDIEAEKTAKAQAKQMLNDKPQIIKLRQSQIREMEKNKAEREKVRQKFLQLEQEKMKPEEKAQNILDSYAPAPLGLNWSITPEKMTEIGYDLEAVEREDYPNSYLIKNYNEKHGKGYENVIASFGENNELWCINAQTSPQNDDNTAKETLKLYNKYFEALSEKYGNPNEYFTAFAYEEEVTEGEGEDAITHSIKKENPRGNPNFLQELKNGKAELYATFHNNVVGVTLSVFVDENSKGQLVLDYKNLPLMKKEKEAFINNL